MVVFIGGQDIVSVFRACVVVSYSSGFIGLGSNSLFGIGVA